MQHGNIAHSPQRCSVLVGRDLRAGRFMACAVTLLGRLGDLPLPHALHLCAGITRSGVTVGEYNCTLGRRIRRGSKLLLFSSVCCLNRSRSTRLCFSFSSSVSLWLILLQQRFEISREIPLRDWPGFHRDRLVEYLATAQGVRGRNIFATPSESSPD